MLYFIYCHIKDCFEIVRVGTQVCLLFTISFAYIPVVVMYRQIKKGKYLFVADSYRLSQVM